MNGSSGGAVRLPWWIGVTLGFLAAVLGVVLITQPFTSLSVLTALVAVGFILSGGAVFVAARRLGTTVAAATGASWVVLGVVVLVWPDVTVRVLAVLVGIALVVGGVIDVIAGLWGTTDERVAAVISGIASVLFGVLALAWPDVTVLVVAVVFGVRLVLLGLRLAWSSVRDRELTGPRPPAAPPGVLRRLGHVVVAVVSLALALALAGLSSQINDAEPVVDSFYDTPDDLPPEPGRLLRTDAFTRAIPDGARAWRILYTTTDLDGTMVTASAIVVVPEAAPADPLPVIAWAHGTTGVARKCAPSVLEDPWSAGAFFALDQVVAEGWALVATDYVGLGSEGAHPYLVGEPAGRSVLDAVRAARQLGGVTLADETVVWGHSQGGGAALWTGVVAPTYAPDANVIGVAALAPASDLVGLVGDLGEVTGGSIFASYALQGYASAYDDVRVEDYVVPAARVTFEETAGRCLNGAALASALSSITVGMSIVVGDVAATGPLGEHLDENVPRDAIDAPLLIAQGEADGLVRADVQAGYAAARCAAGYGLDYRTYPGLDHVPLVEADSPLVPELFEWTRQRLAGQPAMSTCP